MLAALKKLLGFGPTVDFQQMLRDGAVIIDVRTKGEYADGHIKGSHNVPLNNLSAAMSKFKDKNTPIITCCASGMRSSSAKSILRQMGYTRVENGGGWMSLKQKI